MEQQDYISTIQDMRSSDELKRMFYTDPETISSVGDAVRYYFKYRVAVKTMEAFGAIPLAQRKELVDSLPVYERALEERHPGSLAVIEEQKVIRKAAFERSQDL